jgi:hypothetical protein
LSFLERAQRELELLFRVERLYIEIEDVDQDLGSIEPGIFGQFPDGSDAVDSELSYLLNHTEVNGHEESREAQDCRYERYDFIHVTPRVVRKLPQRAGPDKWLAFGWSRPRSSTKIDARRVGHGVLRKN